MPNESELDLFSRSLNGDWHARVEVFKRLVWDNSHIRRLGARTQHLDDFVHDCFVNVLRVGKSYDRSEDLGDWIETVAIATAVDRDRLKAGDAAAEGATAVRLCCPLEEEEGDWYAPPRATSGPDETLWSRMAPIVGEPQMMLLRARSMEGRSWEEAAEAIGKPVNQAGPMAARTVERLARFFCAPPVPDDDLDPVFSEAASAESGKKTGRRSKGRLVTMSLDPGFYIVTPEMRKIGVTVLNEARMLTLWEAASSSAPPKPALREHLTKCDYCAEVLRSLILLHRALASGAGTEFLICPSGFTLVTADQKMTTSFDQHLAKCPHCPEERIRALELEDPEKKTTAAAAASGGHGLIIGLAAALVVVLLGGYFLLHRNPSSTVPEATPAASSAAAQTATTIPDVSANPTFTMTSKYRDLAQMVSIEDPGMVDAAMPENQSMFRDAVQDIRLGKIPAAMLISSRLMAKNQDPQAEVLYGIILYMQQSPIEAYAAIRKAEAMPPRNAYRCWVALQCALTSGDVATVEREVGHLANDRVYGARAQTLLQQVHARK